MKIEIVEFYPIKKDKHTFIGTMHIYILDLDVDLRGIFVSRKEDRWFFRLPQKKAIENGKEVFYPIFSFTSREKYGELLDAVKLEGKKYIKKELGIK